MQHLLLFKQCFKNAKEILEKHTEDTRGAALLVDNETKNDADSGWTKQTVHSDVKRVLRQVADSHEKDSVETRYLLLAAGLAATVLYETLRRVSPALSCCVVVSVSAALLM